MIRSRIAGRSKKGDKSNPGETSHAARKRAGENTLVRRADVGMAAQVRQTQDPHRTISITT